MRRMASQSAVPAESARPPLLAACEAGELDKVAKLLAGGADPNQRTDEHWTPLIMCAKEGHLAIVNLLLEKGAMPRPPDGARHTPLVARPCSDTWAVARLLDAGADINQPSVDAKTALMGAAMNGWPSVVELLLARGADKSLRNAWGETAHELAETMGGRIVADQGHAECARLLVA